ncbi:MAG: NAD(P)-dependent dehydrogenase (short-subunit alcohol dehydrogenase family) [Halioglobus sp.]|jgi:NAD(P)-dependent dehydrogenase (short-subunit alcohol dehydrogenase family)
MQLKDKIIVITGAGGGIGKALAKKFLAEGAKSVVAVDINADTAQATADELGCVAMSADVSKEEDIVRIIEETEKTIGPIDLFCSNAGLAAGATEQSDNAEWQISWDVNVMPHVYAARHLVPKMVERGGGYFLNTASAAGLLNQIGGAAYGVSKHAAVGFAEWLALTYAHQGIKVSMLCPQAVRTAMTENTEDEGTKAAAGDGMMEPDHLADIVVEHLERDAFLILTHEEVKTYMQRKASDYDRWIGGMNRLQKKLTGVA